MNQTRQTLRRLLIVPALSVLASCGGGTNSGPSPAPVVPTAPPPTPMVSLSATLVKSRVAGGTCEIFDIATTGTVGSEVLATATTNASGVAALNSVPLEGAALISCSGGTYMDEATDTTRTPSTMRAVIDTDSNTAPVISPMTEMSVLAAEADTSGILSALATHNLDNDLGIDVTVVIPTDIQTTPATANAEGEYAAWLAIISQLAANEGADTPTELAALIAGIADGTITNDEIAVAAEDVSNSDSAAAANIPDTVLSAVIEGLNLTLNNQGSVTVSGTAKVGETLQSEVTDPDGTLTSTINFSWQTVSSGISTLIEDATQSTYTLTSSEAGTQVRSIVDYVDDRGFAQQLESALTEIIEDSDVEPPFVVGGNFDRGTLGVNDSVPQVICDSVVSGSSLEDAVSRTMTAGTTVCVSDGQYNDLELDFGGQGSEANPITVAAQNPGEVTFSGEVSVRMSGEYVVLQGIIFQDGTSASSDFLQTRNGSGAPCNYCRITEIAVIDLDDADTDSGKWLNIYGHHNRVDHSWFAGKSNTGALLIINREAPDAGAQFTEIDYARIDHNYFGDRPPTDGKAYADNSDNDYEAIRTGTSDSHAYDSFSVVEYNYFERIDGEAEVISNKAGNNRIANNTVRDSYGSVTLRHGASATVSNNFILGDGHPFAAGLRIIDDGHRVVNNYIDSARYLNTFFHGGIVVHDSDGSTSNGYQTVENVLIANNTVVNSVNSLNFHGGRENASPTDIYFVNNIIEDAVGPLIRNTEGGLPPESTYAGNYFDAPEFSDDNQLTSASGFTALDPMLTKDALGVSRPTANGPDLSAALVSTGTFSPVNDDMDGQSRTGSTVSGADEDLNTPVTIGVLTQQDVGPISFRPEMSKGYVVRVPVNNYDFESGSAGWTTTSFGTITNQPDETFGPGNSALIDGSPGRVAQTINIDPNTNYTLSAFARGPVKLGIDLGGVESGATSNNSEYRFETYSFNSGSNSSVAIFASLADDITNSVNIGNSDFTGFSGTTDANWTVFEGAGIGKVQDTSNSASGADGAVKFRWQDNDTGGSPSITQVLNNIETNTDLTLSAYVLDKNDTGVTVTIGVYEGETTNVLASKEFVYAALEDANAPEGDDSFLQDSFSFNSASNTTLTLFVIYNSNSSNGAEVRVDDIEITFEGAPVAGSKALADELRLVSHPELN